MQRDFNDVERLAVAQTFFKLAGELVDTKNPDSLRSAVDRGYKELYERTGSKSFDVMLDGQQVGTYSIRFSKPKPEETRQVFEVNDYEKLARWHDSRLRRRQPSAVRRMGAEQDGRTCGRLRTYASRNTRNREAIHRRDAQSRHRVSNGRDGRVVAAWYRWTVRWRR